MKQVVQLNIIYVRGCGGQPKSSKSISLVKSQKSLTLVKAMICLFWIIIGFKCTLWVFTFAHSELEDPVVK